MAATSTGRALVDKAFLDAHGVQSKKRRLDKEDTSVAGMANKKLYDNFKGWTDEEIDGIIDDDGKSLRTRMQERITLNAQDKKRFPLGKKIYDQWKTFYRSKESCQKKLEQIAVDDTADINPQLLKGAIKYQKTKNKACFNSTLQLLETVSLKDMVGVCQYGMDINPASSPDQLRLGVDLLKFFVRMDAASRFWPQVEIMQPHFDAILVELHTKSAIKDKVPSKFLVDNDEILNLVLPKDAVKAVLSATSWLAVRDDLMAITKSRIGMLLFGDGFQSVQSEIVVATIKEKLHDLFSSETPITTASLHEAKLAVHKKLLDNPALEAHVEKRNAIVNIVGAPVPMSFKTTNDLIDAFFSARWKAYTLAAGKLIPIGPELQLAVLETVDKKAADFVREEVYIGSNQARSIINAELQQDMKKDAASIVDVISRSLAKTLPKDPTITLEKEYFKSMTGDVGQARLQQYFMDTMASKDKDIKIETTVQQLSMLKVSELFQFCSQAAQSQVRSACLVVHAVAEGRAPTVSASHTSFLKEVVSRCSYFCVYSAPGGRKTFGHDAIVETLLVASQKKPCDLKLEDLELYEQFAWLANEKNAASYSKLNAIVVDNGRKAGVAASRASGEKTPAPKKNTGTSEVDAALKMFNTVKPKSTASGSGS